MLTEGTTIVVPGGKEGHQDFVLDLGDILIAEQRQNEVASVTPIKAPELLALFNAAWRDVDRMVKQLTAAKIVAEREIVKRQSTMLLEEVSNVLKAKGVDSTKDTRDAVIALDPTIQARQERADQIVAACEYLKGKLKSFENAFSSVKKIMGEDAYNMAARIGNPNLRGSTSSSPRPSTAPSTQLKPRTDTAPAATAPAKVNRFGTPRYDR